MTNPKRQGPSEVTPEKIRHAAMLLGYGPNACRVYHRAAQTGDHIPRVVNEKAATIDATDEAMIEAWEEFVGESKR